MYVRRFAASIAVASVLALLLLGACNRTETAEEPRNEPQESVPGAQLQRPKALFLFVVPPPDPKYPEREVFTPAFSKAAEDAFAAANWEYREIRLYEKPTTEWIPLMRKEIDSYPTVVFSYHDTYSYLFVRLSETVGVRSANYVLALSSIPPEASSQIFRLDFRMEELGFIGGVALAHMSRTGHIAVLSFEEEWCDRFVAGFTQGVREIRAGARVADLRVSRMELVDTRETADFIWGLVGEAKSRSSSGLGVDAIAVLASGSADPFISSLMPARIDAISGITPPHGEWCRALVLAVLIDFGRLPLFFVENADNVGLFKIDVPVRLREGAEDSPYMPKTGRGGSLGGVKVITAGMREGVLRVAWPPEESVRSRFPDEVESDIAYYERAIEAGEVPIYSEPIRE